MPRCMCTYSLARRDPGAAGVRTREWVRRAVLDDLRKGSDTPVRRSAVTLDRYIRSRWKSKDPLASLAKAGGPEHRICLDVQPTPPV